MWIVVAIVAALLALTAFSVWRDPRKFRTGLYLTSALLVATLALLGGGLALVSRVNDDATAWVLLAMLGGTLLLVIWLSVALIGNGLTMVRRERRTLANLLSLLVGAAMLAYMVVAVVALAATMLWVFLALALIGLPIAYFSYGFVAYLLYSALYQWGTKRFPGPVDAVVILGSGLVGGRVPPLLASRLDRGLSVYRRAVAKGHEPLIVTSGGKGDDETRPEADAMADYLADRGVVRSAIVTEDRSRTTGENLANTAAVLASAGVHGDVAVVTNNFHAFRGALLMRKAGLGGYVVGSPTASYYWPSATIREYVAILRDHLKLNVTALVVTCCPLLVYVVLTLTRGV